MHAGAGQACEPGPVAAAGQVHVPMASSHVCDDTNGAREVVPGHLLAPALVGQSNHRCIRDSRMLQQHALDLGRVHVLAAGADHILGTNTSALEKRRGCL